MHLKKYLHDARVYCKRWGVCVRKYLHKKTRNINRGLNTSAVDSMGRENLMVY